MNKLPYVKNFAYLTICNFTSVTFEIYARIEALKPPNEERPGINIVFAIADIRLSFIIFLGILKSNQRHVTFTVT